MKSNLCNNNDFYILVRGDTTVIWHQAIQVAFKNCTPFTKNKCITKIDGTTIDEYLDLVMPMYNFIEYSSSYYETTWSLYFHSKDKTTNFNANITNTDDFKSFKYKAKSLGNTEADNANGVLKKATIVLSSKYLSNFWRSLEMSLTYLKVELKLKCTIYCVLSVACVDNINNINSDNIIFTIKDTKWYVPVVTLSARENQKLSRLLSKGFERSVYWNKYKAKSENKNTTNQLRYYHESNFVGVNRLFVLVYTNEGDNAKRLNAIEFKTYDVIINVKNFYD